MSLVGRAKLPVTALRLWVVLPGAFTEGALAVALPWALAQALLGSAWLGAASAGLVLAAMLGTLAAPALERALGNRRMTVLTAFLVVVALGASAWSWVWQQPTNAFGFAMLAITADAACDIGFTSRMPLFARLSGQKLERFSGGNWLWGIGGAAFGSVVAGWAIAADHIAGLLTGLVVLSLIVAVVLAVVLPRPSRRVAPRLPALRQLVNRRLWTPAALKVAAVLMALAFFAGPLDNLLLPAHLASQGMPSSAFGDVLAAIGLGLAAGLWRMQSGSSTADADLEHAAGSKPATERQRAVVGLLGLAGQLGLMLWLPPPWLLLAGLFVCAWHFAPLLPMLEARVLTVAPPLQRTLMLAAMSTLVGAADALGTVSLGALMSRSSSAVVLGVCVGVACLLAVACSVRPLRPPM